mmetsp:Transcript_26065/g.23062  ORF Transcript_26065/g.23062 Transcript_26065/m.23062 type:complete len:124 (+) Transcript_26065:491-862(+)
MALIWSLISTLQLLSYLVMCTLYYPKSILTIFPFITFANFKSSLLTQVYLLHIDESVAKVKTAWDYRFKNQGIEYTNILMNCGDVFLILFFISVYYLIIYFLDLLLQKSPQNVSLTLILFIAR